jgi:hypothetical protein
MLHKIQRLHSSSNKCLLCTSLICFLQWSFLCIHTWNKHICNIMYVPCFYNTHNWKQNVNITTIPVTGLYHMISRRDTRFGDLILLFRRSLHRPSAATVRISDDWKWNTKKIIYITKTTCDLQEFVISFKYAMENRDCTPPFALTEDGWEIQHIWRKWEMHIKL